MKEDKFTFKNYIKMLSEYPSLKKGLIMDIICILLNLALYFIFKYTAILLFIPVFSGILYFNYIMTKNLFVKTLVLKEFERTAKLLKKSEFRRINHDQQ